MAAACGVAVANVYFPQAITTVIASGLGVSTVAAALPATAAQIGYAVGIFFLVPLGDRVNRRGLVTGLLGVVAAGLLVCGLVSTIPPLVVASVIVGAATVVPQVLIPMAAGLVEANCRGAVVGMLQGGLLAGVLLSRTFGGELGGWVGWRAPYLIAAGLAVGVAALLAASLPAIASTTTNSYRRLLTDMLRMWRAEPALRRSCWYQATLFGGFSAVWTAIALLLAGPSFQLGAQTVGVVALVGAASVVCAPAAGRRVDRVGPEPVNRICILTALAAAAVLVSANAGHWWGLVGLVAGILLLDVAVQCNQVANQARIFALDPAARSRLNTVYMTCAFLGGSAGSWVGVQAYTHLGWLGVCALLGAAALLALARHLLPTRARRRPTADSAPAPEITSRT